MDIKSFINNNIVVLDGAMGTQIFKLNKKYACPEELNLTAGSDIAAIHTDYVKAGSDVVYTNTFQANRFKLPKSLDLEEVISQSIINAKKSGAKYVVLDVGPTGRLIEPMGDMTFEEAYDSFKEVAILGKKHGADAIILETIASLYEMRAGVLAVKENTDLPVFCTMTYDGERTVNGTTVASEMLTLSGLGVDAVGFNCSVGPDKMLKLVEESVRWTNLPIIVKANAGLPNGKTFDAKEYALSVEKLIKSGATMVGGCCGTSPEYIKEIKAVVKNHKYIKRNNTIPDAVCSEKKVVTLDSMRVVGERINPTGKKPLKLALISSDYSYIDNEALSQAENGAELLDVNCGLPEIDETVVLPRLIKRIQGNLPLMIDSSDCVALEKALRVYNGIPVINSVNGTEKSLNSILPLAKKYGAYLIALCIDEEGISSDVNKRVCVANKIIDRAKAIGIPKNRIIADTLTLSVAVGNKNAKDCLETLRLLSSQGVKTALGVSNVSFGLPSRVLVNSTFLACAINCGLTLAIMNPLSKEMIDVVNAMRLLEGASVEDFVKKYSDSTGKTETPNTNIKTLEYCIIKGLKEDAGTITEELIKTESVNDVIENRIAKALDTVGKDYESGKIFLPELIASSESAKASFDVIKAKMINAEVKEKGAMILATVKGDIHDIGKNIVKAVVENYGYNVIDLGKDVCPEVIVETAIKEKIKLIGLSALMTTTAKAMEDTIKLLKQNGYDGKVIVGGAVITREYAEKIGADYYSKDAMQTANIVKSVFGEG